MKKRFKSLSLIICLNSYYFSSFCLIYTWKLKLQPILLLRKERRNNWPFVVLIAPYREPIGMNYFFQCVSHQSLNIYRLLFRCCACAIFWSCSNHFPINKFCRIVGNSEVTKWMRIWKWLNMVVPVCNPSTGMAEAGRLQVWVQFGLHERKRKKKQNLEVNFFCFCFN